MLIYKAKLKRAQKQYGALNEAVQTATFVRNSCLRYWRDNSRVGRYHLNKYCQVLADNTRLPWTKKLNSMVRQAPVERAGSAIAKHSQPYPFRNRMVGLDMEGYVACRDKNATTNILHKAFFTLACHTDEQSETNTPESEMHLYLGGKTQPSKVAHGTTLYGNVGILI